MANISLAACVVLYVKALFLTLLSLVAVYVNADRFDDFIQSTMQAQRIPGLQFVVVYRGRVTMSRAYGLADLDKKTPVAKDTEFEIASVSKPLVATAVMMLWEQGKLKLEDPVGKYVSEMPLAWSSVSIRNLLSHTSGIPEFRGGEAYFLHRFEDTPFMEMVKPVSEDKNFDAGDHFAYSNTNYLLLGKLIEGITKKPYTDYMQTEIFDRLGMTATGFIGKKAHAKGYSVRSTGQTPVKDCSLAWAGPGASIVSTAEDMARFDAALLDQKLIKRSTLALMIQPTGTKLGTMDYGLGWQTEKVGPTIVTLHSGKMNGFSSMYLRLPDAQISVILLTNSNDIDGNTLTRGILGLYFPELDPAKLTPIVDDDPDMTVAHTKIMQSIVAGKPDMDVFTDDYKAHVTEEKLLAVGAELRRGGRIQRLQIVKRTRKGQFEVYAYMMSQGQTQLIVTFFVDDKGKVAGLTLAAP